MTDLISRLHSRPDRDAFADVTFILPDGSELKAHKFVLAVASPVFEAQFFGPLADTSNNNPVTVKDVDSTAFRRLIDCIYKSDTDFLETEINIKEEFQDYWLLLQAAHMYLVSNVIHACDCYIHDHVMDMFYLNKYQKNFDCYKEFANENLSELVDIMNEACELSIYDHIAEAGTDCVVNQLPGIVERNLLNKLSDDSIKRIVEKFKVVSWEQDTVASLDLVCDILENGYDAPGILDTCFKEIGWMIANQRTKKSFIIELKRNSNIDWSRPKWKKFIHMLKKMSWKKLCGEKGILKMVEHLEEYKEGGRDDGWEALEGSGMIHGYYDDQTNWGPWERESNNLDIYSELIRFADAHEVESIIDHCRIRLARNILSWSETDSEDAFKRLNKIADESEIFQDLVDFAEQVMRNKKVH